MKNTVLIAACLLMLAGCRHNKPEQHTAAKVDYTQVSTPQFNADSAYAHVAAQLAFGNRTPGSKAWQQCAQYIERTMQQYCDTVIVQPFTATLWDGSTVPGRNIVATLNPTATQRVMLAAHWDSRLWADHDPDASLQHSPVPGANDGASGVAVLIEMAHAMSTMPPSVGVDFVFFDTEDQGLPDWSEVYEDNTWCKGSQYWASNRHVPFYTAVYGLLFDMVGTTEPRFTREQVSRSFAPGLVNKVWNAAAALGYGNIFVPQDTDPILDDHLYVNQIAGIPMADIVQNSPTTSFFAHWHTTTDNLSSVSAQTMQIVGSVALTTIYADFPHKP